MTLTPAYLGNTEAVVKAFGYWPSFHDAPVVSFQYSEGSPGTVELTLHGWEMTSELDAQGYYKLIKHHLVRFTFHEISDADLRQFVPENLLFGLSFSSPAEFEAAGRFTVSLDSQWV